jgi:hypothetical protein
MGFLLAIGEAGFEHHVCDRPILETANSFMPSPKYLPPEVPDENHTLTLALWQSLILLGNFF